ncbi:MAG TPA: hypothetical protein VIU64_05715 [Polyangia bacterium]
MREPGDKERHRRDVQHAIDLASGAIDGLRAEAATDALAPPAVARERARALARARSTLLHAHAARARDARQGAGQLSLGSQRAPTLEACHDGWQRVEEIVAVAEASARAATQLAVELGPLSPSTPAWKAARAAEAAARAARRLIDERNDAYTFHADPGFSFGEGWYLAAAAMLAGVSIQIEPDKPQTAQVQRFVRDAGLAARVVPYRPRPRANKQLPDLVARAFRADPLGAQARLRAAFLGDGPVPPAIVAWAARRLAAGGKTVLLWVRYGKHHPNRNTAHAELVELTRRACAAGCLPVLVGDALRDGPPPPGAVDLTLFWKDPLFQAEDMRRAQLQLFEHLRRRHGLAGQLGVTTAGMDGPALLGLPTMYLTDAPNVRLGTWVGAVPGYEEVVRAPGYLDRVVDRLMCW